MRKVNALTVASASSASPAFVLLSSESAQGRKRTWMERMADQFERRGDVRGMPEAGFVSGEGGGDGGLFRGTAISCSSFSASCRLVTIEAEANESAEREVSEDQAEVKNADAGSGCSSSGEEQNTPLSSSSGSP